MYTIVASGFEWFTASRSVTEESYLTRLLKDSTSLPSFDRRPYDNYHSNDDSSDGDTSDSRGSNNDSALDNALQQSLPVVEGGVGGVQSSVHLEPSWFVVFPLELSNPCSLVVGKIVSIYLSGDNEGEVRA